MHGGVLAQHLLGPGEMSCLSSPKSGFLFLLHPVCKPYYGLYLGEKGTNLAYRCQFKGTRDSSAAASGNLHPDLGLASLGVKAQTLHQERPPIDDHLSYTIKSSDSSLSDKEKITKKFSSFLKIRSN